MLRTRIQTTCNALRAGMQVKQARFTSSLTAPEPEKGVKLPSSSPSSTIIALRSLGNPLDATHVILGIHDNVCFARLQIFESVFAKSSMPRVSMDVPFPGLPTLEPKALVAHSTTVSTLPNGIRVVSQDSDQPIASVGAFVDAGSRYETHANSGISHFLEFIAFKVHSSRGRPREARHEASQTMGKGRRTQGSRREDVGVCLCLCPCLCLGPDLGPDLGVSVGLGCECRSWV